jgi:hypothetical protein
MRKLKFALLLAGVCLLAIAVAPQGSATPPPWAHGHGGGGGGGGSSIALIAPWGTAALTGVDSITLTYSVSASSTVSQTAIDAATAAAQAWANWLSSHDGQGHFTVQAASAGSASVPITIKAGGGTIAGQTKLSYDAQGFINAANVQISGSSFGLSNDYNTVYEITLHELGHAFVGLGHSNDPNDLMYPTLNGTTTIGTCELSGFDALYGWLEDGSPSTGPALPASSSVPC